MSQHQHTFHYDTEAELISQMEELICKLRKGDMQSMVEVHKAYPHLSASTFFNRVNRFRGAFPHEKDGRGIYKMYVTPELHAVLIAPLSRGKKLS